VSIHVAKEKGYEGVIAATSGNYGAAVASQAARNGLKCIICQETFDSRHLGQPEIVEKARICEAFGAEVVQMTVGPELFAHMLELLDETGYFAASLYSSFGVSRHRDARLLELAEEMTERTGAPPTHVVITHAGGGNTTGTARGLKRAGATGDRDRQRLGRPLAAAHGERHRLQPQELHHRAHGLRRALRHLARPRRRAAQRRALAALHGPLPHRLAGRGLLRHRGAGQARGARARSGRQHRDGRRDVARRDLPRDATVVVQETEYTGAGKHHWAQLNFAREMGVEVRAGDPRENVPGKSIVIPERPEQIRGAGLRPRPHAPQLRAQRARKNAPEGYEPTADDIAFLAEDTNTDAAAVEAIVAS
jgi:2-amino-4-ketopentanoate thiolase beta subunit